MAMTTAEAAARFATSQALDALPALCRRFGVRRLDLFGSAATGRFDPARSDLDFLVLFEHLPPGAYADAFFGLREGLEALFGRPVDLVTGAALGNPHFRRRVEAERRALFPAATARRRPRRRPPSIFGMPGAPPSGWPVSRPSAASTSTWPTNCSAARWERQLGIVGEALAALRRADPALAAAIPELPRVVAFRDTLVHGYASVDDRLAWGVVERDLAGLLRTLERLLGSGGSGPESR